MMLRYSSFFRNSSSNRVRFAVDMEMKLVLLRLGRVLHNGLDDRVGVRPLRLAFEIQQHPMPERSIRDRADVVARNMQAIVQQRANLSADDQRLRAARTRSVTHILHS